jgi:hypothetical protein
MQPTMTKSVAANGELISGISRRVVQGELFFPRNVSCLAFADGQDFPVDFRFVPIAVLGLAPKWSFNDKR